jgi:hypothetical protein
MVLTQTGSYSLPPSNLHNEDPFDTLRVKASGNRVTFMVIGRAITEKEDEFMEGFIRAAITAIRQGVYKLDNLELWL